MSKFDIIALGLMLPALGFTIGWIFRGLTTDYFSVYMMGFLHGIAKDYKLVKTFPKEMIDEFLNRKPKCAKKDENAKEEKN